MSTPRSISAAARWTEALAAWAIPQEILDAAPESPWGFPPALFHRDPEHLGAPDTPSHRRALEALPDGGSVLDVGVGGGAGSLPLAPPAAEITGVDQGAAMLESFARAAREIGVKHSVIEGSWPDIASRTPRTDVVVCHHVFYNVPDLRAFVIALSDHARHRVVAELSERHPLVSLNDLWRHFHGGSRPEGPRAEDAQAVLAEAGIQAYLERFDRPPRHRLERRDLVAFVRRRLCLSPDQDAEIDELLGDRQAVTSGPVVALWWDI